MLPVTFHYLKNIQIVKFLPSERAGTRKLSILKGSSVFKNVKGTISYFTEYRSIMMSCHFKSRYVDIKAEGLRFAGLLS